MNLAVTIEDAAINRRLAELQSKLGNLRPFLSAAAITLQTGVDEAFSGEKDPVTGSPWTPLKPRTLKRRRSGDGAVQILNDSGRLASNNVPFVGDDFASVSNNLVYAAVHQFGSRDGSIPARPFFGISDETRDGLLDLMATYLS